MAACRAIPRRATLAGIALIFSLQLVPVLAVAAIATYDLTGLKRAEPASMGALEVQIGLAPPRGLSVTVQRLSH